MNSENYCGGCNCSGEMTAEMLERKEKMLQERLEMVKKQKKELEDATK